MSLALSMAGNLKSLADEYTRIKVSSSLDSSVGKKHLCDANPETCWTSQQGLPQFIHLTFSSPVTPKAILITFQGGFVGTSCAVKVLPLPIESEHSTLKAGAATMHALTHIYPEDINGEQTFGLPDLSSPISQLQLIFETSSDFFGRITIYDLRVLGTSSES